MKANEGLSESEPMVGVKDIVHRHWAKYGRHFYCRYDYEGKNAFAIASKSVAHSNNCYLQASIPTMQIA
jgi:phosphoglucomutase